MGLKVESEDSAGRSDYLGWSFRPVGRWSGGQVEGSLRLIRGRVRTSTFARVAIVSRLERSISLGSPGQGLRTTAATSKPAARADSRVSRVWLIVPRPGAATMTSG